MKRLILMVGFVLFVSINSFSIGLTFAPIENEQNLIEHDGKFPISFYDFPLFIGVWITCRDLSGFDTPIRSLSGFGDAI